MSDLQPSIPETSGCFVGTLFERNPRTEATSNPLHIYSNEEICVGRDRKKCHYVVDDPFISNRHLRIYTIIFDRENLQEVAPLVYAQDISMNGSSWNNYPMGKGNGSFLLSDGDTLKLSPSVCLLYRREDHRDKNGFDMLQTIEMKVFEEQYTITQRKLGSGAYGQVHMAFNKKTGQQLACKIIDLRNLKSRVVEEFEQQKSRFFSKKPYSSTSTKNGVVAIRGPSDYLPKKIQEKLDIYNREAKILESLCHPNIIGVEKVIKTSNTIYIFEDLVTSGDLFSFIQYKGGKLDNIEAAVIVRQVLMALDYLHERNIVHRDLKPDNILMTSLADGCRVVLTDFGCARLVQPTVERMSTIVGTFEYSAPEVLKSGRRGYTKAVDLWSLGCVTTVLLTGESPFRESFTANDSTDLARQGHLEKLEADLEWNNTGKRAKDFVLRLLVFDETKRMDVEQALSHSWFTNPAHRREFEALYRRSIKDWRPRVPSVPLIVNLSSLIEARKHLNNLDPSQQSEGCSSPEPCGSFYDNYLQQRLTSLAGRTTPSTSQTSSDSFQDYMPCAVFSPTLSDPELPPHGRMENDNSSQFEQESDLSTVYTQSSSVSPDKEELTKSCLDGRNNKPEDQQDYKPTITTPRILSEVQSTSLQLSRNQVRNERTELEFELPWRLTDSVIGTKRPCSTWDRIEDEVYEEVRNNITGKKQHLMYGTNILDRFD